MKILVLNYEFPPIGGGGGAVCAQVSAALADRGHEVWVHTVRQGDLPKIEQQGKLTVQRSFGFRRHRDRCSVPEMAGYLVGGFLPAWRRVRTFKPDVIHAHFAVPTGALAYALSWLTGVPYVITAHLGDVPGGVPEQTATLFRLVKPFTHPIWRRAQACTAVSHFVKNLAEQAYDREVEVIPNPVAVPAEQPQRNWHGSLRLLFVGRLSKQKNVAWFLKVLAELRGQAWQFTIVGDGPLRHELEQLVGELGLQQQVDFLGWLPKHEVFGHLCEQHALVLPSTSEGMPVAVLEGMAHGLPILASALEPLQELVRTGENGALFPVDDTAACRQIVAEWVTDDGSRARMGEASYLKAQWFSLERIIDAYDSCLKDVTKRGS